MLTFIEPCGAAVEIIYKCPKCACEHKLTRKQTEYPGVVTCYCKSQFRVRPIKQIKVTPLYRDVNRKNFVKKVEIKTDDAINCLAALGYKKLEISKKLAGLLEKKAYNNVDNLIKDFILGEEMRNG